MDVLSAVQTAITEHGATQVTIVGHSLGTFDILKLNCKIFLMIDLLDFVLFLV